MEKEIDLQVGLVPESLQPIARELLGHLFNNGTFFDMRLHKDCFENDSNPESVLKELISHWDDVELESVRVDLDPESNFLWVSVRVNL